MNLWLGQVNLILTAMIMLDLLGTRPSRWRGVLLGIAAAVKLTPGVFVLYLLVRRRWREAGNAVAAFVAATGLAAAVLPSGSWKYWTDILWHGTGVGTSLNRHDNKSVLGVADRLFGSAGGPVWAVLVIPVAIAGLWVATLVSDTGREAYALGLVGVTGCLVSPVSWPHHWIWLIPALAGAAHAAATRGWPTRIAVAVGALYFVPATQLGSATLQQNIVVRAIDENSYLVVAVALLAFAAVESRQASRASRSSGAEPKLGYERDLAAPA
jgi:alpha-1,2-mannosyltransferase